MGDAGHATEGSGHRCCCCTSGACTCDDRDRPDDDEWTVPDFQVPIGGHWETVVPPGISDTLPTRTWVSGPAGEVQPDSRTPHGWSPQSQYVTEYLTRGCPTGTQFVANIGWLNGTPVSGCYPLPCPQPEGFVYAPGLGPAPCGPAVSGNGLVLTAPAPGGQINLGGGTSPTPVAPPSSGQPIPISQFDGTGLVLPSTDSAADTAPPPGWQPQPILPPGWIPARPPGAPAISPDDSTSGWLPLLPDDPDCVPDRARIAAPPTRSHPGAPDFVYVIAGSPSSTYSIQPPVPPAPCGYKYTGDAYVYSSGTLYWFQYISLEAAAGRGTAGWTLPLVPPPNSNWPSPPAYAYQKVTNPRPTDLTQPPIPPAASGYIFTTNVFSEVTYHPGNPAWYTIESWTFQYRLLMWREYGLVLPSSPPGAGLPLQPPGQVAPGPPVPIPHPPPVFGQLPVSGLPPPTVWTSPAVGWSEVLLGRCDSLTEHEPQILDYPDLVAKQQAAAKTWKTADLSLADLSVLELALDQTMLFWPLQFDWPQLMNSYLWPDESRDWVFYDPEVFLGSSKYAAAQMDIKIETVRRWAEYVYSHTGETCFTIRRLDPKVDRFPLAWYGTGGNDMTKDVEWALQHFTFGFDARVTVRALRQSSFQVPTVTRFTMQYYPLVADRYEFKNRIDTGLPIYSSGIVRSQDLAHLHVTGLAREFGIFGYGNPRECTWEQGRLLTYVPCKAVERLRPRHLLGVRVLPPTAGLSRLLKELYGRLVK